MFTLSLKGLNLDISRYHLADDVKELYSNACRTCSTIIFPHSTNQIVVFWRRRCPWRCCRPCLSSLIRHVPHEFVDLKCCIYCIFYRFKICSSVLLISADACCIFGNPPHFSVSADRIDLVQRVSYFDRGSRRSKRGCTCALGDLVPATRADDSHCDCYVGFLSRICI